VGATGLGGLRAPQAWAVCGARHRFGRFVGCHRLRRFVGVIGRGALAKQTCAAQGRGTFFWVNRMFGRFVGVRVGAQTWAVCGR